MTARFTLLRALLDRAHPGRREYERFRATPEEAAEAVQAARAKFGATVQAEAKPGENPAAECGPECAEQHMYAYRCALKPPPISPWKILGAWQAAPAPTSPDRRQRYADALRTTPSTGNTHKPGQERFDHHPRPGEGGHNYTYTCALCRSDVDALADAVMAVRDAELEQARAELDTAQRELETSEAARASLRRQRAVLRQAITRRSAARTRVRKLHGPNPNSGTCEHCSERDYPDYSVPWPCDTIRALGPETIADAVLAVRDAARGQAETALDRVRKLREVWADAPDPLARAMADDLGSALNGTQRPERSDECPTPESHNWGCGCPTDQPTDGADRE